MKESRSRAKSNGMKILRNKGGREGRARLLRGTEEHPDSGNSRSPGGEARPGIDWSHSAEREDRYRAGGSACGTQALEPGCGDDLHSGNRLAEDRREQDGIGAHLGGVANLVQLVAGDAHPQLREMLFQDTKTRRSDVNPDFSRCGHGVRNAAQNAVRDNDSQAASGSRGHNLLRQLGQLAYP